MGGVIYC